MEMQSTFIKINPEKLYWKCPEDNFKFESTAELEPLHEIIGQPRAIESLKLGAEINAIGYNIFVTGLTGTGRTSAVEQILNQISENSQKNIQINDFAYVNNFEDEDKPILLRFPKGVAKIFAQEMDDSIHYLRSRLPKYFDDENFQSSRKKIIDYFQNKEKSLLDEFDKKIAPHGFIRGQLEMDSGALQPEVFPLVNNEPIRIDELSQYVKDGKVSDKKAELIQAKYLEFHKEILDLARKGMKLIQEFRKELAKNDKKSASAIVASAFDDTLKSFPGEKIKSYIENVKNNILDNLSQFVPAYNNIPEFPEVELQNNSNEDFSIYKVNIILDNSNSKKAPIIIETNPTYSNLFGTIEKTFDKRGFSISDFTKIRAGSILKADQGFLIVNANDLFSENGVWQALKRVLLHNRLEIQPYDSYFQMSQSVLKPEKIKVNVKVIIIGGQSLYNLLYSYEKGFKKIFKVNARFDTTIKLNNDLLNKYAAFISKICNKESLYHCSPSGVAAIIEWAVMRSGTQNKITLRFSEIADVLREAAFYDKNGNNLIEREDVELAFAQRKFRNNLIDEKLKEQIIEENTLIYTQGKQIGQINGLTIIDTGNYSFGKPAKITAAVGVGNGKIINIEREADLSGKIHNKAVLIISGYLREKFARNKPLSLTGSIAFEQNYGGIDGDSASAAEIYVLLSSIAEVPINQNIAITGSVNQKGEIQPIGGVNEKIFGFYEICKERGFTGNQGVIIPSQNVSDLMLEKSIIEDVKEGRFSIYSIANIEDGVKLLFDLEAGKINSHGEYTKDSLFYKVDQVLDVFRKYSEKKNKEIINE